MLNIIKTNQLAPIKDSLVDADPAVQFYHNMNPLSGKSTNKYFIGIVDKAKIIERLGLDAPTCQQQGMRFHKPVDPTKHGDMMSDFKNYEYKKPIF